MPEQPKPRAYCAALLFDDGQMLLMPVIGPDAPGAMAIAAYQAGRHTETKGHLTGYRLIELEADWLRQALRLLDGGRPTGEVVSLVPREMMPSPDLPPQRAPTHSEVEAARLYLAEDRCPSHTWQPLQAGICPLCQPNLGGAA